MLHCTLDMAHKCQQLLLAFQMPFVPSLQIEKIAFFQFLESTSLALKRP